MCLSDPTEQTNRGTPTPPVLINITRKLVKHNAEITFIISTNLTALTKFKRKLQLLLP